MRNNPPNLPLSVSLAETMDLGRLRLFVGVVELGSFTEAARYAGLPKSSVSKAVRALEEALGVQLLQRTSRSVRATDAGQGLYTAARPALALIHEALLGTSALGAEPRGRVRISVPPDLGEMLASYVGAFCLDYPRVQVDVSLSSRNVDLVAEGFDLALRGGKLHDSGLISRGTLESGFGLFASPHYLESHPVRSPKDLHRHVCIGVNATRGRASWKLSGKKEGQVVIDVACQLVTDDMRFATLLAVNDAGIALLPDMTTSHLLTSGSLVRVLPMLRVPGVKLHLLAPSRDFEPMAVRLFREGLLREPR